MSVLCEALRMYQYLMLALAWQVDCTRGDRETQRALATACTSEIIGLVGKVNQKGSLIIAGRTLCGEVKLMQSPIDTYNRKCKSTIKSRVKIAHMIEKCKIH